MPFHRLQTVLLKIRRSPSWFLIYHVWKCLCVNFSQFQDHFHCEIKGKTERLPSSVIISKQWSSSPNLYSTEIKKKGPSRFGDWRQLWCVINEIMHVLERNVAKQTFVKETRPKFGFAHEQNTHTHSRRSWLINERFQLHKLSWQVFTVGNCHKITALTGWKKSASLPGGEIRINVGGGGLKTCRT